jgi:hypothetical protein
MACSSGVLHWTNNIQMEVDIEVGKDTKPANNM